MDAAGHAGVLDLANGHARKLWGDLRHGEGLNAAKPAQFAADGPTPGYILDLEAQLCDICI